ncbi:MAG: RNA 2',3'-cyclic phosphodiesterase [Gammaproteobacteria bacterium]
MNEERPRRPDHHRLFFALWPGQALSKALAAATADAVACVSGNPVPPANFHVTLAFLGMVPGRGLADLIAIGGRGPWPKVRLGFDRIEYWHKPRVLVALADTIPTAGLEIVDRLWGPLVALGIARETRPWRPHLTLARRVERPPARGQELPIRNNATADLGAWGLVLVESVTHPEGPRYKPLADWPLGP